MIDREFLLTMIAKEDLIKKHFRAVLSGRIFLLALGLAMVFIFWILRPLVKIRIGHFHEGNERAA